MKSFKLFCTVLAVILLFSGCSIKDKNDEVAPSDENVFLNQDSETENISTTKETEKSDSAVNIDFNNIDGETTTSSVTTTEPSVDEMIQAMEGMPFQGTALFLSPDNPDSFSPLIYNGDDFTFYYQVGATDASEYGIAFMLNGIYQDIKIEYDGLITDYSTMHIVSIPAGKSKVFKIMLRPNIGKKGDVLQFCNASVSNPLSLITEDEKNYELSDISITGTLPSKFTMKSDSTNLYSLNTNYSNMSIGNYGKNLRTYFSNINPSDEMCQMFVYNDLAKSLYKDDDIYRTLLSETKIEAESLKSYPLTIAMSGKPGTTQRISFYLNNQIVPVFDGKYYADVKMEKNKQTTVNISIDTAELNKWNNFYLVSYTLDAGVMDAYALNQSDVYVLKVIK